MLEEYAKKPDHYCNPHQYMTATTLSDAMTECSENFSCHMFFDDGGTGNNFYACENTASIMEGSGYILYQKQGNNLHTQFESFRVKS